MDLAESPLRTAAQETSGTRALRTWLTWGP